MKIQNLLLGALMLCGTVVVEATEKKVRLGSRAFVPRQSKLARAARAWAKKEDQRRLIELQAATELCRVLCRHGSNPEQCVLHFEKKKRQ